MDFSKLVRQRFTLRLSAVSLLMLSVALVKAIAVASESLIDSSTFILDF